MRNRDDEEFMAYWKANRERQQKFSYQLLFGFPVGLLFAMPIFINFLLGQFWYKRADAVGSSQFNPLVLIVAVICIATFAGVFYKKFQWERNEDRYLELTRRKQ